MPGKPLFRVGSTLRKLRAFPNIFKGLGFIATEAEFLKIRSTLTGHLRRIVRGCGLSQAAAAKLSDSKLCLTEKCARFTPNERKWEAFPQ